MRAFANTISSRAAAGALAALLFFPGGAASALLGAENPALQAESAAVGNADAEPKTSGEPSRKASPSLEDAPAPGYPSAMPPAAHLPAEAAGLHDYEIKLSLARDQRRSKDYEMAEVGFLYVINSSAPDDVKQQALSDLAAMCEETRQQVKAQRIYTEWIRMYPQDPSLSEVYLRQGLLYRDMGASTRALAKFYAVMSSAISAPSERADYYKRLVLRAQTEIAETFLLDGKYSEAADKFKLLLKLENPDLNRSLILYKLIRCLYSMGEWGDAVSRAEVYLRNYPDSEDQAEVRFLFASSLKKMGRTSDSLTQVTLLLQTQKKLALTDPDKWRYWQQRTGNEIGNQLYQEGDFVNALIVYTKLAELDSTPSWQLPVLYQMGLIYEQLKQPEKAVETYGRILARQTEIPPDKLTALQTVIDMAKWRQNRLNWQAKAEQVQNDLGAAAPQPQPADAKP